MRYLFFLYLWIVLPAIVFAQPFINEPQPASQANTYAVVIGISAYADPDIQPLEFSNRDAVVFADFLMSASGGSVPKQNIKLLVDSGATSGEVDKAIRWLKTNSKKDDIVYFYFSGHGALENVTMFNNGYLICYNTPSVAFVNMALSIDYLNDVANTLSVQTKANVIIITDACHSGKMAGSQFKGNYLVGEQLLLAKEKEIRMASCTPDQLSNEKKDWGGGRGVFSYHLINGLQGGLADKDKNKSVSLGELKNYVERAMANDPILKSDGEVQTPVIKGRDDFQLAKVVQAEAVKVQQQVTEDSVIHVQLSMLSPVAEADIVPEAMFFSLLKKESLEGLTEELKLDSITVDAIAFTLINTLQSRQTTQSQKHKLEALKAELRNDKEKMESFNIAISRAINDKGQDVILKYIKGDEAELERRRYYNVYNSGYDIYPRMFSVALKLSKSDKYIANNTAVLLHYFTGVALRLKIPVSTNQKILIEQALAEQKKALDLEEHAAYIYNELGILYQYKNDYVLAEENYIKASRFSPRWAIPQSNLCGLYGAMGKYEKALEACHMADSLQAGLQSISVNRGLINEQKGNLLFAEEYYRNSMDINSRHYLPFERLGNVYMKTANYAQADSFLYEASLRKAGFHFEGNDWTRIAPSIVAAPFSPFFCKVDTSILKPTDIFAFFTWGVQEYEKKEYIQAARILKKVIAHDKTNPLVFHYLGKIFYDQQKWEEAEVMFKLAILYSKDEKDFERYVDSVKRSVVYPYDHSCFEAYFAKKYYLQKEDYYFAGTLYESWKHVEEAEQYFRSIIKQEPAEIGGYLKLWRLYESQGRFNETEEVIKKYAGVDKERYERELNAFYRRTIEKFPYDGNWNYKLGILLYSRASFAARVPYFDSIVWFPLLNKELLIDFEIYGKLDSSPSFALSDKASTGAAVHIYLNEDQLYERTASYGIPGTGEYIDLADAVYLPRKDGINYLKRAAELLSEKEALADIHFKIGNIYLWAGSKKQSYPYFERSLELVSANANARLTLVDIYTALFKNRAALDQLNYLYDSSQINFQKRILLSQFNIHAGQFEKGESLLDKAEAIHPYVLPEIADLRGRLYMLANKPTVAIKFYRSSLNAQEENDPWFNSYSLARLYATTGNTKEAWKWLQLAFQHGFNYSFVLENDPYMENLRKTTKWQTMLSSITMKKYLSNFTGN